MLMLVAVGGRAISVGGCGGSMGCLVVLCVASGVTMGGHIIAMGGRGATQLPPRSHPSQTTLPTTQGRWCPHATPLPRPSHTTSSGAGHPPSPRPHPHGGPLTAWPRGPKKSDFIFVLFLSPVTKHGSPWVLREGRGASAPHPAPQPPVPSQGAGALFRIRLAGGTGPCAYLSPQDPRPLCHPAVDR